MAHVPARFEYFLIYCPGHGFSVQAGRDEREGGGRAAALLDCLHQRGCESLVILATHYPVITVSDPRVEYS